MPSYEPTMLPARTFADGEGVVLTPSDINRVLLRIFYVRESRPPDRMMPGAADDGTGTADTSRAVTMEIDTGTDTPNSVRARFAALFRTHTTGDDGALERIFVIGTRCSRFYATVVGACMAWYALCPHECPSVIICDPHYEAGTPFGHSKGYALRRHALMAEPRGFSALMLRGIVARQKACARTAPRPNKRRGADGGGDGAPPPPLRAVKRRRFIPHGDDGDVESDDDDDDDAHDGGGGGMLLHHSISSHGTGGDGDGYSPPLSERVNIDIRYDEYERTFQMHMLLDDSREVITVYTDFRSVLDQLIHTIMNDTRSYAVHLASIDPTSMETWDDLKKTFKTLDRSRLILCDPIGQPWYWNRTLNNYVYDDVIDGEGSRLIHVKISKRGDGEFQLSEIYPTMHSIITGSLEDIMARLAFLLDSQTGQKTRIFLEHLNTEEIEAFHVKFRGHSSTRGIATITDPPHFVQVKPMERDPVVSTEPSFTKRPTQP
jgi:hypothetical protein